MQDEITARIPPMIARFLSAMIRFIPTPMFPCIIKVTSAVKPIKIHPERQVLYPFANAIATGISIKITMRVASGASGTPTEEIVAEVSLKWNNFWIPAITNTRAIRDREIRA
jgi:hypothetical protein